MSPLILVVIATAALAVPVASHSAVIGIEWDGEVFTIDETTGGGSLLGTSGYIQANGLARNSTGTLYSAGDSDTALITIDPATGAGTQVAALEPISIRALAFSSTDALYAIHGCSCGVNNELRTIDASSGVTTLIGTIPFLGVQALAFSPSGILYGFDVGYGDDYPGAGLITIDPATGAAVDVNPGGVGANAFEIQTIAFSPDGVLYGARDSLYTIDPVTGDLTLVGDGPYDDIRGIEFSAVPEPNTGMLVTFGLFGLAGWRRGRA